MSINVISPESLGLSSERLSRIVPKLQSYVDANLAPGFITLIARKDGVMHYEAQGYRDVEQQLPMEKDTIFRIYSMTKPITSIALMMLYEEGKFHLHEPVSKYIPEFAKTKVLTKVGYFGNELSDQQSPMTVHQLLTHTSGLTYGFFMDNPVEEMMRQSSFSDHSVSLEDTIKEIAGFPLIFQPGARWHYGVSTDVCGYLVQLLSGMPFDVFLQERIFEPLGMVDTGFHVPEDKLSRFTSLYTHDWEKRTMQLWEQEGNLKGEFTSPTQSPYGGHGLVSTTEDYYQFAQMLLNKGELDGTRIISRKTLEFMTGNHLKPEQLPVQVGDWTMEGLTMGLGFGIITDAAQTHTLNSVGNYGWGGAAATNFWVDPQEGIVGIIMTQIMNNMLPFGDDFRVLTYQAII